jgi:hypothetical protein
MGFPRGTHDQGDGHNVTQSYTFTIEIGRGVCAKILSNMTDPELLFQEIDLMVPENRMDAEVARITDCAVLERLITKNVTKGPFIRRLFQLNPERAIVCMITHLGLVYHVHGTIPYLKEKRTVSCMRLLYLLYYNGDLSSFWDILQDTIGEWQQRPFSTLVDECEFLASIPPENLHFGGPPLCVLVMRSEFKRLSRNAHETIFYHHRGPWFLGCPDSVEIEEMEWLPEVSDVTSNVPKLPLLTFLCGWLLHHSHRIPNTHPTVRKVMRACWMVASSKHPEWITVVMLLNRFIYLFGQQGTRETYADLRTLHLPEVRYATEVAGNMARLSRLFPVMGVDLVFALKPFFY